jgi:hypothetical protein
LSDWYQPCARRDGMPTAGAIRHGDETRAGV